MSLINRIKDKLTPKKKYVVEINVMWNKEKVATDFTLSVDARTRFQAEETARTMLTLEVSRSWVKKPDKNNILPHNKRNGVNTKA